MRTASGYASLVCKRNSVPYLFYVVFSVLTVAAVDAVVLSRAPIATHLAGDVQETISCKHTHTQTHSTLLVAGLETHLKRYSTERTNYTV